MAARPNEMQKVADYLLTSDEMFAKIPACRKYLVLNVMAGGTLEDGIAHLERRAAEVLNAPFNAEGSG